MTERAACPCCGYRTLADEPGSYEVCPVCLWEDDGAPPWAVGGPNGISLVEAQQRFRAADRRHRFPGSHGRRPRPDESRDPGWRPLERTEDLLARVEQARVEMEKGFARHPPPETDDALAAFNAEAQALRAAAGLLSHAEVSERYAALGAAYGIAFPPAELELLAHLLRDRHWPVRHPVAALGWAWRHRRTASLARRLGQLRTGRVRLAG